MNIPLRMAGLLLAGAACAIASSAAHATFKDPLDHPAIKVGRLAERPMHAVAKAGTRLVAVGPRGLIVVSADQGRTWSQVVSPVQSDLVAVHFPSPAKGWVVGHDGVVLHSTDGAATWVRQLDGRLAQAAFMRYYGQADTPQYQAAARAVARNYKAGAALPLLDVWFDDELTGFAVGAFGMLIGTTDGGKTWNPWLDRIDNPEQLNLNAIRGGDGGVYVAAERGGVFRLDRSTGRFVASPTGYEGSFFGVAVSKSVVLAFGLRGAAYRSTDKGSSWQRLEMPSAATISAGAALDDTGGFVLANNAGDLLVGDNTATRFTVRKAKHPWRYTGATQAYNGQLLFSALEGIQIEPVK
jgi:photosystem II stability/assembly factor-like uncharacterized protein